MSDFESIDPINFIRESGEGLTEADVLLLDALAGVRRADPNKVSWDISAAAEQLKTSPPEMWDDVARAELD